jgi:2-oxoglutarate ferredoxin oxidoreductase subunit beta
MAFLQERAAASEIPVGLLFIDERLPEMHEGNKTIAKPLSQVPFAELCPGSAALDKLQQAYR